MRVFTQAIIKSFSAAAILTTPLLSHANINYSSGALERMPAEHEKQKELGCIYRTVDASTTKHPTPDTDENGVTRGYISKDYVITEVDDSKPKTTIVDMFALGGRVNNDNVAFGYKQGKMVLVGPEQTGEREALAVIYVGRTDGEVIDAPPIEGFDDDSQAEINNVMRRMGARYAACIKEDVIFYPPASPAADKASDKTSAAPQVPALSPTPVKANNSYSF